MKTKLICIAITLVLLIGVVVGIVFYQSNKKVDDSVLNDLTMQSVQIEETGRRMISETEGEVYFNATIPDFTEIYSNIAQKAKSRDDVFKLVEKTLDGKNYLTTTHKITAKLTVENGKEIVHTDEALDKLLENVLIEAINKAMEVR